MQRLQGVYSARGRMPLDFEKSLVAYRHCDTLWKVVDGFEELLTLTDFINLSNKLFST